MFDDADNADQQRQADHIESVTFSREDDSGIDERHARRHTTERPTSLHHPASHGNGYGNGHSNGYMNGHNNGRMPTHESPRARLSVHLSGAYDDYQQEPRDQREEGERVNWLRDEHRRALEQVRRQLEFTHTITNHLGEGIYALDLAGRVTFMNPAGMQMLGWDESDLLGRDLHSVVHAGASMTQCNGASCPLRAGMRARTSIQRDDEVFVRKSGETFPVAFTAAPLFVDGKVAGVVFSFRDISEQKRAEAERARLLEMERAAREAAEAAQRRLAFLSEASVSLGSSLEFDAVLEQLATLSAQHLAAWCLITMADDIEDQQPHVAYRSTLALGATLQTLAHRYPTCATIGTREALTSGTTTLVEEIHEEALAEVAADAEHLALLRQLAPTSLITVPLMARGQMLGAMSLATVRGDARFGADDLALVADLTRRAGVALDNALLYRETRQALRQQENFISIASHELRTPLTTLKMVTQLTQRHLTRLGVENGRQMGHMEQAVIRMERLVGDMLDISRIDTGKLLLRPTTFDLRDLCRRVGNEQAQRMQRKVRVSVPRRATLVQADAERIEQLLDNLLSNAFKYSSCEETVTIRMHIKGEAVHVSVADAGVGIPKEARERLFERFYRVPGTQVQSGSAVGLGLGLHISREIAERHGGGIWLEDVSTGCTVTFSLPLAK